MAARDTVRDFPIDLNRERQRDESEIQQNLRRMQELQDIEHVMSSEQGRRFMWRMLSLAGVFRSSMTGNSQTFFNEGMRVIGTTLMGDIAEAELEELELKMRREARNSKRAEKESKNDN